MKSPIYHIKAHSLCLLSLDEVTQVKIAKHKSLCIKQCLIHLLIYDSATFSLEQKAIIFQFLITGKYYRDMIYTDK